jgi:hypothetical protein
MNSKTVLIVVGCTFIIATTACQQKKAGNVASVTKATPSTKTPGPLPENGFKAQIVLPDPPTKLRTGQKENITVKVKNASDVVWWLRGGETNDRSDNKFYIAVGNHWLDKDGKRTADPEGHNGIPKDLKPGEEAQMTLLITAPGQPGEYTIELDMVQEAVAWFGDKGSPTTKAKVTVVR